MTPSSRSELPWQVADFAATEIAAIDESTVIACPILGGWLRNTVRIMLHATGKYVEWKLIFVV